MKKFEVDINLRLHIEANETGEAMAAANTLLLKLSNNLIDSRITNVKEDNS